MLNPKKENFVVEIIDSGMDSNVLSRAANLSLEPSLHEEVIQSAHEQQGEIFAQASEKVFLHEIVVNDINDHLVLQGPSEISFLMIEECNKELDHLVVISYEDDLHRIHTIEEQNIQDSISDSSSYVSCFEMLFQEEICSSTSSEFFEDQEHTFSEAHDEGISEFEAKDTLFFQHEVAMSSLHVFQDPMADLLQPGVIVFIAVFSDEGEYGQLCFWMPSDRFVLLTRRSNQENQSRSHLLDWLHWKAHYT